MAVQKEKVEPYRQLAATRVSDAIMPTSDMIFFVIGVADYLFLLLFIAATGFVTRREARG